jgi:hypothetical protein
LSAHRLSTQLESTASAMPSAIGRCSISPGVRVGLGLGGSGSGLDLAEGEGGDPYP